jgi:hypothetical protein
MSNEIIEMCRELMSPATLGERQHQLELTLPAVLQGYESEWEVYTGVRCSFAAVLIKDQATIPAGLPWQDYEFRLSQEFGKRDISATSAEFTVQTTSDRARYRTMMDSPIKLDEDAFLKRFIKSIDWTIWHAAMMYLEAITLSDGSLEMPEDDDDMVSEARDFFKDLTRHDLGEMYFLLSIDHPKWAALLLPYVRFTLTMALPSYMLSDCTDVDADRDGLKSVLETIYFELM